MEEITQNKVDQLKNKYEHLQKELSELKQELNYIQSGGKTDSFLNPRRTTERVYLLEEPKKQKTNHRFRLETYELLSGIIVDNISFNYHPIVDEAGKVIKTNYFKFNVDARINQLRFHMNYVSDQSLESCARDEIRECDVLELELELERSVHGQELREAMEHFRSKPQLLGLALLCLKDYEQLYTTRQLIRKTLIDENSQFVNCKLCLAQNEKVYLEMTVANENTVFFIVKWFIVWNENLLTVQDKFDIQIELEDEEFLNSVSHNFEKLTKDETSSIIFTNPNDDKIISDELSKPLTKSDKLTLFRNAILAAKAAA